MKALLSPKVPFSSFFSVFLSKLRFFLIIFVFKRTGPFYSGVIEGKNELWARAGVLAVEMEISVLFVIASLRGIRAGTFTKRN